MPDFIQIIEYEGDNSTFIWKHPREDFNTMSQLIVHESQEAIFFKNGQALDLFGPGRYTLETQNIPILRRLINLPTDGKTPFHCEVYFINKVEQMAIKWGTDSKIQYIEPTYNFPISIGASGEMSLRVEDSRRLLLKIVGTEEVLDQAKVVQFFRAFLMTKVKAYIAQILKANAINIFEIDEHLDQFSDELKERLKPDFMDYGICLERYFVTTVVKPDGDSQYERFKDLYFRQYADVAEAKLRQQVEIIDQQTQAQKIVIESQAIAQKRVQEGYTYGQERGFDVAEKAAENEGAGNFSSAGIGLGMIAGVGGAVGTAVGGVFQNAVGAISPVEAVQPQGQPQPQTQSQPQTQPQSQPQFCDNCGAALASGAVFCEQCGTPQNKKMPSCLNCGFIFEREGKFCPKCGTRRDG
ncbi:SPFH domain-containing protein [Diplocloster hominis]|uniref:SPFH domain-containing protein n=1 Tax=Diplocloster hominis TaxID=3079010 RepID=UPI0031BB057B